MSFDGTLPVGVRGAGHHRRLAVVPEDGIPSHEECKRGGGGPYTSSSPAARRALVG
jgi:hypothetical protein